MDCAHEKTWCCNGVVIDCNRLVKWRAEGGILPLYCTVARSEKQQLQVMDWLGGGAKLNKGAFTYSNTPGNW